jgi:hypothetical protein
MPLLRLVPSLQKASALPQQQSYACPGLKPVCRSEEMKVSKEEIEAAKTANGGWTRETLAKWGVSWPPPKGWKKELENADRAANQENES